jgi:LacI family transcriptional regulator
MKVQAGRAMATIKDVARLAGVGVGTASRVISGKGSFSKDAAERVATAVKQLGFRPSATARALSLRSTGTIGVFIPDFQGPFYGPLLHAIDTELRQHDRHMVAANGCGHEDPRQQALDGARFLIDRECDGIVITSNALKDVDFLQLKEQFANIAVVNRDVKGMKSQCFTVDHRAAGRAAAQTLLDHGHRRIAVVSGPGAAGDNRQRMQGFFERLTEDGIANASVAVEEGEFNAKSGWAAAERLLKRKAGMTALFCANDQMAMGALSCLQNAGVSVPGEVSVLGYDDTDVAAFLSPRLTSVHIPVADMGLNACRMLMNACYGMSLKVSREFEPVVSVRDSVKRL